MKTASFDIGMTEYGIIHKIVDRAKQLGIVTQSKRGRKTHGVGGYSRITCYMDLIACHANGMALDLSALLESDDFNFAHDVCGIARHINRTTGEIEGCFVPRFALKQ